jgi:hypothetical protein
MPHSSLVDYINECFKHGYSRDQVREALVKQGWPPRDVDEALGHVISSQHPIKPPIKIKPAKPPQFGVLGKFRMVLRHPGEFFNKIKEEKGYEAPIKFYLFIMFIDIIVLNLIFLLFFSIFSSMAGLTGDLGLQLLLSFIFSSILSANLFIIVVIGATFLVAGILHVIAIIFGAKKGYQNTYKALIYSSAPSIFVWIGIGILLANTILAFALILLIYLWIYILLIKGLKRLHDLTTLRAFMIVFLPIVVVGIFTVPVVLFGLGIFDPTIYPGRIATGFTSLGTPMDWDLESDGDFRIILSNNMPREIEIMKITASTGGKSDSYEPPDLSIPAGGVYSLDPSESGLDLGSRPAGSSYRVEVEISYRSNGMNHKELGSVSGAVSQ